MLKIFKKEGFASFVEVIITSVIFSLAAVGIYSTLLMTSPELEDSGTRIAAVYKAKQIIEELRDETNPVGWNNPAGKVWPGTPYSKSYGAYTISYALEDVPGMPLRKLTMEIRLKPRTL